MLLTSYLSKTNVHLMTMPNTQPGASWAQITAKKTGGVSTETLSEPTWKLELLWTSKTLMYSNPGLICVYIYIYIESHSSTLINIAVSTIPIFLIGGKNCFNGSSCWNFFLVFLPSSMNEPCNRFSVEVGEVKHDLWNWANTKLCDSVAMWHDEVFVGNKDSFSRCFFSMLFSETFFSNSQNVFSLLGTVFDRWINTTALSGTPRYTNTCRPEQPYQKSMLRYKNKNKIIFVCLIKQNKILYNMSTLLMFFQQILLISIFNSFSMCFSLIHSFTHSFIHSSIHSSVPLRSVPFRFISFHPIPFHSIPFHS